MNAQTKIKEPRYGDVRVGSSSEYDGKEPGFVIEQYGVYGWAIPAWEERGFPDLADVFPTKEAALEAIAEA